MVTTPAASMAMVVLGWQSGLGVYSPRPQNHTGLHGLDPVFTAEGAQGSEPPKTAERVFEKGQCQSLGMGRTE